MCREVVPFSEDYSYAPISEGPLTNTEPAPAGHSAVMSSPLFTAGNQTTFQWVLSLDKTLTEKYLDPRQGEHIHILNKLYGGFGHGMEEMSCSRSTVAAVCFMVSMYAPHNVMHSSNCMLVTVL